MSPRRRRAGEVRLAGGIVLEWLLATFGQFRAGHAYRSGDACVVEKGVVAAPPAAAESPSEAHSQAARVPQPTETRRRFPDIANRPQRLHPRRLILQELLDKAQKGTNLPVTEFQYAQRATLPPGQRVPAKSLVRRFTYPLQAIHVGTHSPNADNHAYSLGQAEIRRKCQWQPKTAHFGQLKTAHFGRRVPTRSVRKYTVNGRA